MNKPREGNSNSTSDRDQALLVGNYIGTEVSGKGVRSPREHFPSIFYPLPSTWSVNLNTASV